jgi:HAD superfamily hydrolase (TIGR01490 family)
MKLAIFDLDNTLICGDSDYLWGKFLCENGYVDAETHKDEHQRYYDAYKAGTLDIQKFLTFQLRPLAENDMDTLEEWRSRYLTEIIEPLILPKACNLLDKHRQQGHVLLVITATNSFLTEPISRAFGVENLIASDPEIVNGRYTGQVSGTPSYAAGKVSRFHAWLDDNQMQAEEIWFYSDSHNDIPLLEEVTHPIAVDPDTVLQKEAETRGWPIISLR